MISIITITFNNFEELNETLKSIQGLGGTESVVVNGGSCSFTRDFLKHHSGSAISEKDRGISDAFNKGLALSQGDALMFLNSGDVLVDRAYIDWANGVFSSHPDIDFTYSGIVYNDSHLGHVNVAASDSETRSLARGMPYPHQSLIIRKSVFAQIGNFDESFKLAMDFDVVLRMKKRQLKGLYYSGLTVLMDGSGTSSKNDFKVIKENYRALKKNQTLTLPIYSRLTLSLVILGVKKSLAYLRLTGLLAFIKRRRYKI